MLQVSTYRRILLLCVLILCLPLCACGDPENDAEDTFMQTADMSESTITAYVPSEKGIFWDVTGIEPSDEGAVVGSVSFPAELVQYEAAFNCSYIEYLIYYYNYNYAAYQELLRTDGRVNWGAAFQGDQTVGEYASEQTEETLRFYAGIETIAVKNGITLTQADLDAIEADRQEVVTELGSEEAFEAYLRKTGLSRASYDRVAAYADLFADLIPLTRDESSALYLSDEKLNAYATYADYIYIASVNLDTYAAVSADEFARKKAEAEAIAADILSAEDPAARFAELADEKSEDPYRSSNPNGYIYTAGTMSEVFEAAAAALASGEVSGLVEGSSGWYIILRKDLPSHLAKDPEADAEWRESWLRDQIRDETRSYVFTLNPALAELDIGTFYDAYAAKLDTMEN